MSTNPTTESDERQAARVHSAEKLCSFPYTAPTGNTVSGSTTTVTVVDATPKADVTIVFVTEGMVKAGLKDLPMIKNLEATADLIAAAEFKGASKATLVVPGVDTRVVLVGLGNVIDGVSSALYYLSENGLRQAVHAGVEASKPFKPAHIAVVAPTLPVNAYDSVAVGFGDGVKLPKEDENAEKPATPLGTPVDAVSAADVSALVTRTAVLANHAFDKYLAKPEHIVKNMSIVSAPMTPAALGEAVAVAEGVMLARELCNDRADIAHPGYFEAMARALGEAHADVLTVRVMQHDELVAQGYNLITAVGQAARHKARIVVLEYKNTDNMPQPIAMVGKGVCFDAGGLNIKLTGYIENMHEDCGGASAVMGAMHTLCRSRPQKHVIGVLALAENAVDSLSFKPHAIIPSHIGSVQIGNTDAEGRLCLADALTHVQTTYKPSHVIDIATLTGACVVALGEYAAGVFSNSPKMASALQAAGESGYERLWPLPILREHQAELKGDQADFNSTGRGRYGGSSTAASFIEKFIQPGVAWAHLDIAGAASASAKRDYLPKGASGFGVQTLYNYAK